MNDFLEIGQILSLIIKFNNLGDISSKKHPYLIIDINKNNKIIEIGQLSSLKGKEAKLRFKNNFAVFCDNEIAIDKDSFIQLDNIFTIEYCDELLKFRRQIDKISNNKLEKILNKYNEFKKNNLIEKNKIVYMSKNEIKDLNKT